MNELLILAISIGFAHSFEADHLVAVSSIVTARNNFWLSIKDGIFWGLGHTSIILLVGVIFVLGKLVLHESDFKYFEAVVGFMLIVLGFWRLLQINKSKHAHNPDGTHKLAYGIGAIHGLAGSGAVLLTVLTQSKTNFDSLLYLIIFGIGSILGMMVAAGIFSLPFSTNFFNKKWLTISLSIVSSLLCLFFGGLIIYKNLF